MKKMMKKRWISLILCAVLAFPVIGDFSIVQAAQTAKQYDVSQYITENGGTITRTYPKDQEGYVFAGWYTDEACTVSFGTGLPSSGQQAWAKFVDADVLSVKFQISADTVTESSQTNLRMITTVDGFKYQSVGFKISTSKGTITPTTRTVYESLYGYSDGKGQVYRPSCFSEDSNYFMAYTLKGIQKANFDAKITVTPQWTTLDGTVVDGITRSMSVNSYLNSQTGLIFNCDEGTGGINGDYNVTTDNYKVGNRYRSFLCCSL